MAPSTGAQLGMSMTLAMSDMELTPTASPSTRRAERQGRGDQGPEGEKQDERRDEQADELAQAGLRLLEREEEVAAHLDPQRRPGRGLGTERLEVAEVLGRELVHERVLQPDQRDAPVRRHDTACTHFADVAASAPAGSSSEDVGQGGGAG